MRWDTVPASGTEKVLSSDAELGAVGRPHLCKGRLLLFCSTASERPALLKINFGGNPRLILQAIV